MHGSLHDLYVFFTQDRRHDQSVLFLLHGVTRLSPVLRQTVTNDKMEEQTF